MKKTFLLVTFFCSLLNILGQFQVEHFTIKQGLKSNRIEGITQSDDGRIWILNAGEICEFDGKNFIYHPYKTDLTNFWTDYYLTYFKYSNNRIYLGGQGGMKSFDGINYMDFQKGNDSLTNFYDYPSGNLLGTITPNSVDKYGRFIYNGYVQEENNFYKLNDFPDSLLIAISQQPSTNGLYHFRKGDSLVFIEKDSYIYVKLPENLTEEEKFQINYSKEFVLLPNIIFYLTRNDRVLITDYDGLNIESYDLHKGPSNVNKDLIYDLLVTQDEYKFAQAKDSSIVLLENKKKFEIEVSFNISNLNFVDSNELLIFSNRGSVALYNIEYQTLEYFELPSGLEIECILNGSMDNIWIGTNSGLYKLCPIEFKMNVDRYDSFLNSSKKLDGYISITSDKYLNFFQVQYPDKYSDYVMSVVLNKNKANKYVDLHVNQLYKIEVFDDSNNLSNYNHNIGEVGFFRNDSILIYENGLAFTSSLSPFGNNYDYSSLGEIKKVNNIYYLQYNTNYYTLDHETKQWNKLNPNQLSKEIIWHFDPSFPLIKMPNYDQNLTTFYFENTQGSITLEGMYNIVRDTLDRFWLISDKKGITVIDSTLNIIYQNELYFSEEVMVDPFEMLIDYNGNYWIPSDYGLFYMNSSSEKIASPILINKNNGLPGHYINDIYDDGLGRLWLLFPSGIHWLDLNLFQEKNRISLHQLNNYEISDDNYAKCFLSNDKKMYFLSDDGKILSELNDIEVFSNREKPQLQLESIFVNTERIFSPLKISQLVEVDEIQSEFSYTENDFLFKFRSIDYRYHKDLTYTYELSGPEGFVKTTGDTEIEIQNLPPGEYVLKVKAKFDRYESESFVYSFVITPPFWLTWWFISIIVVFSILIVYGFYRIRIAQLKKKQKTLESIIKDRTKEIVQQKDEIEEQKEEIEEAHKEITDSINYAKRIQAAILPPQKIVKEYLQQSFILYKPKDVVAGDFYWMEHSEGKVFFAAADCTGHGVPGAMVSVVCNNALNRSVREYGKNTPGEILDKTKELVIQEFEKSEDEVKDGMDIALCCLDGEKLTYSGAHNPLWIVRDNKIIEVKADKQPIGKFEFDQPFTTHEIELQKGDSIYIFSDGYPDQFGGEKGKKYKTLNLKKFLLSLQEHPMEKQRELLDDEFESWRGSIEQIDDVCIIGVRI